MNYLRVVILFLIFIFNDIYSQSPPSDFKLVCTSEGLIPWSVYETITILANGQVEFVRIKGTQLEGLVDTALTISSQSIQNIWQAVQNNNFFLLNDEYTDDSTSDGSKVLFTITANGNTSQVAVKNISQQEIENIIASINSNIPAEFNIDYRPPEKFDVIPTDPCGESSTSNSERLKVYLKEEHPDKFKIDNVYSGNSANELQIPHGGFEIGYEMSMHDAIASSRASTKGKGGYFGDGVSITGNNTDFPPPGNRIKFKLYLEFFGPCDNPANESKIVNDIYRKWRAQTTCDGKMIDMEIVTLSHYGEKTAPGTPGFDNIKLECGTGRSNVPHLGTPNTNNTANGTWYPEDPDNREGLFAHEAGHLMGLEDQYVDWIKLKSGNWYNSKNRGDSITMDEMKNLLESRAPDLSPERIEFDLEHRNSLSIPNEKHENDMMARVEEPILQSDICSLSALAGLIIKINTGDILASTALFNQNLVVTHTSDFFLRPGEIKTLNGIYIACIDRQKNSPHNGDVFNIVPSLDKWNGSDAAVDLLKLVKYIDSAKLYCGENSTVQHAIWRITDDLLWGFGEEEDIALLFKGAGINVGNKIYNFPRLSSTINDTGSIEVIPKELFIPDIQPKSVLAEIGENLSFNAEVFKPDGVNYTTTTSWIFNRPDESSSQITSDGSFTPDTKGIYSVSVKIDITDPLNNKTEYNPATKAYVVVPDKFTETFEHANLDWFHWETYGDSKWQITDKEALTGSYSVRSGEISDFQSTSLSISVNLPKDTLITFAVKMLANSTSSLNFYVDSSLYALWGEGSGNWQIYSDFIRAGEHKLTWTVENFYGGVGRAWIDDIFFPANSVVTSINTDERQVPKAFMLFRNYPNPFNPSTTIKYSIPKQFYVTLKVYDILGRKVATLVNEAKPAGNYQVEFNAANLPSGVYFYRIQAGSFKQVRKMLLIK